MKLVNWVLTDIVFGLDLQISQRMFSLHAPGNFSVNFLYEHKTSLIVEKTDIRIPVRTFTISSISFSLCVPARPGCGSHFDNDPDVHDIKADGVDSPKTNSTLKPTFGDVHESNFQPDCCEKGESCKEDYETVPTDEEVASYVLDRMYECYAQNHGCCEQPECCGAEEQDYCIVEPATEELHHTIVREILQELYESVDASQVEGSNDESILAVASENPVQPEVI